MSGTSAKQTTFIGNLPVISETIQNCIRQGYTTAVELATIAGISDSAVSRYALDDAEPKFSTVRAWVQHHPDARVRTAFALCLVSGSDMAIVERPAITDATPQAAMTSLHKSMEALASETSEAYAALVDGKITSAELSSLQESSQKTIGHVQVAMHVFETIHEQGQRKQARRAH